MESIQQIFGGSGSHPQTFRIHRSSDYVVWWNRCIYSKQGLNKCKRSDSQQYTLRSDCSAITNGSLISNCDADFDAIYSVQQCSAMLPAVKRTKLFNQRCLSGCKIGYVGRKLMLFCTIGQKKTDIHYWGNRCR